MLHTEAAMTIDVSTDNILHFFICHIPFIIAARLLCRITFSVHFDMVSFSEIKVKETMVSFCKIFFNAALPVMSQLIHKAVEALFVLVGYKIFHIDILSTSENIAFYLRIYLPEPCDKLFYLHSL